MNLTFLGGSGTVTGSKFLLAVGQKQILIDCGLFQGYKELRLRNWASLPFNPESIDAVLITHAHIDHTGYLPLLVKKGFTGPIYATQGTCDLASVLLPDSGYLQEEEARNANKYGYSKHHPALPLYTKAEAETSLKQFHPVDFDKLYSIFSDGEVKVKWHPAGHIVGAALVEIQAGALKILFTGDIGRSHDPVMKAPAKIENTDYLIIESTYGNRLHDKADPKDQIETIIKQTAKRGGTVLIPAFAVGRAQIILYYLYQLKKENKIPNIPIFLDSPMAISATGILHKHQKEHRLTPEESAEICNIASYVNTPEESKALDENHMPKIIISASGMMEGGRILFHLQTFATDPRNTILLTGYQAGGTRGDRLLQGERELKIHGQIISVRAQVENLSNTSAHADYEEVLAWLRNFRKPPRKVFIVHGEKDASANLKQLIESEFGWNCSVPQYLDKETL